VIEVHESVAAPQCLAQLIACHHVAWALEQHSQDLEGLNLQANPHAVFAQLTSAQIHLKRPEARLYLRCL
jgi:hypothetical protein